MKKTIQCVLGAAVIAIAPAIAQNVPRLRTASIDEVINAMTLDEKASLVVGTGMAGFTGDNAVVGATLSIVPGAAGTTAPIRRLGIPSIVLADGPAGLRISPTREGKTQTYYCTAFPVGTLLASTWNTELVENVGRAMGAEVHEYGVDILLAPALNIHRNPLCGRNFEYYSEDPLVTGKIAAAIIRGIQSNGVGVSIKHFAVNNQETNRMGNDAQLSQRALREIYLKGFEIAVKESQPWTVMSSYNKINGIYASENRELLTDILRNEWGFKGVVMTDWFGGKDAAQQMYAGNDLLMPGRPDQKETIIKAVNDGTLNVEHLNTNVRRILELIRRTPSFKRYKYSNTPDLKAHAEITRSSAAEGMTLLKNEQTLPLPEQTRTIAAFGVTSYDFIAGGTGSGDVNEAYTVALREGLDNAGYRLDKGLVTIYEQYLAAENSRRKPSTDNPLAAFLPTARPAEPTFTAEALKTIAGQTDVALITLGRNSGEFADRKTTDDFLLTNNEQKLISDVCHAFHAAGKKAVVILNIGGVIETASWKDLPDAILLAWQAGQEGGNSVADILSGRVNPSGKLPMTFPVDYKDTPSADNFPTDYNEDLMAVLTGAMAGGGQKDKKEPVRNVDYTVYEEDIYVGYRHFETFATDVSYPFGHGLSYTTFAYSNPTLREDNGVYAITVDIKNTGAYAGKEVVQVYSIAPSATPLPRPARELKAFAKTPLLLPGETQTLSLQLTADDLAVYDEKASAWTTHPGNYQLLIGSSSYDVRLTQSLPLNP